LINDENPRDLGIDSWDKGRIKDFRDRNIFINKMSGFHLTSEGWLGMGFEGFEGTF
jgi:hypothetical protein